MKIEILDSVECEVTKTDAANIIPCLSFKSSYWVQGPNKKSKKIYMKQVFSFKGQKVWRFYTGLLPRVLDYCGKNNIEVELVGEEFGFERQREPFLKGPGFKEFRDYQLKLIDKACEHQRGLIVAPTGSGKTVTFLGLISCYPELNILILCHTTTIISQTVDELKKFGFKDIQQFGGGNKIRKPSKRIVVSTIQSFAKLAPEDYMDYFHCVIVDEAHAVAKQNSQYSKVLGSLLAPCRYGFTATPLKDPEAQLTYEGLLGPIIGELTIHEASELKILADPKLKLIKADFPSSLSDVWNYQDTYEKIRIEGKLVNGDRLKVGAYTAGISENDPRNQQIAKLAKEFADKKQTVLIFVTHIEHGERIQYEIENLIQKQIPFVQGSMPQDEREKVKSQLLKKEIFVCISTVSWQEGLNIPNLAALILAGGGRNEKQLLQKIGRVLRRTKDKDQAFIIDFLDLGSRHLILHTGERLGIYSDLGWL